MCVHAIINIKTYTAHNIHPIKCSGVRCSGMRGRPKDEITKNMKRETPHFGNIKQKHIY